MTTREQLNDITKQIETLQAQRQKLCKEALAGREAIDETASEIFRFFARCAPDAAPPSRTFRRLIWDDTVKIFELAIEEVEKQIRTAPNRLNKLRHRQPVIEGKE